jgi:hypothetical protein
MGRLRYPTKHPATSLCMSSLLVPVQGGYGAFFAIMVQILLRSGVIAVQTGSEVQICHCLQFGKRALAQRSRYKLSRSQKIVMV